MFLNPVRAYRSRKKRRLEALLYDAPSTVYTAPSTGAYNTAIGAAAMDAPSTWSHNTASSEPASGLSRDDRDGTRCAERLGQLEACSASLDTGYPAVDEGDLDAFELERARWTFQDIVDREA